MPDTRYIVPSVEKAIAVRECLHDSDMPPGTTEISRAVGLNRNMVFRLLRTLKAKKWVVRGDGQKYSIALRPFYLFAQSRSKNEVHQATHGPLHDHRTLMVQRRAGDDATTKPHPQSQPIPTGLQMRKTR